MRSFEQAVVFCGGVGTRLKPITDSIPKPMVPVNGKPFLEHLLAQMADYGIRRFLLLTGYLGEQIQSFFGDGKAWGWKIEYSHGPAEWETGRRFWEARQQMDSQFLLLYSDNFVQFPKDQLITLHQKGRSWISLLIAPKAKGNIRVSESGHIEAYDKTRSSHDLNFVEVGYMIVERDHVLNLFPNLQNHPDFSFSEVLQRLADMNQLAGLIVRDPYHSISDVGRLESMRSYLKPKNILLIDRDGVINQRPPKGEYVGSWNEFIWIPETKQAMRDLAQKGFKFIVISNQAGIARGIIDAAVVKDINCKMIEELHNDGVAILDMYVCPHHWDDKCECRKPAPGMFFKASREHLLRMDRTIFIGDDPRDSIAAYNAGCKCVLIDCDQKGLADLEKKPSLYADTLLEAVPWICEKFEKWEINYANA